MKYKDTSRTYTCILCRFFILEVTQNGYRKNPEERTCLKYSLLYLISSQKLQNIRKKVIMPCTDRNQRMYTNENKW